MFLKQNWLYIAAFLAGVVIGSLVSFYISDKTSRKTFKIYMDHVLSLEEKEAIDKFNEGTPEIAIYAQDRLISHATRLKEMDILAEDAYARIVGFAEGRKGLLYESIGESNKSIQHLKNAVELLKKANITTNISELKSLLISSKSQKNEERHIKGK